MYQLKINALTLCTLIEKLGCGCKPNELFRWKWKEAEVQQEERRKNVFIYHMEIMCIYRLCFQSMCIKCKLQQQQQKRYTEARKNKENTSIGLDKHKYFYAKLLRFLRYVDLHFCIISTLHAVVILAMHHQFSLTCKSDWIVYASSARYL